MTPRRRRKPRAHNRRQGGTPDSVARLVRAYLRRNRVDLAPVRELGPALDTTAAMLTAAVTHAADLEFCGPTAAQYVCWVPPDALAAGFEPVVLRGELALRLSAADTTNPPLHITGRHLGPAPDSELELPELQKLGVGPLGYTVARLLLMADRWLPEPTTSTANLLFRLIAHTWRTTPQPVWSTGRLSVYQGGHASATRLELVVWADERGALHLINVYPAGTHRTVFDVEVPDEQP